MRKREVHKIIGLRDFAIFLPFVFLSVILIFIDIFFSAPWDDNSKGVTFLKNKDFSSAVEAFSQVIDKNYLHSFAHLNLALSQDLSNNPVKALNIYSFVSKNFKGLAKFYGHFNQGELNGRLGKLKETLEQYQSALEFQIKTVQIKENIEYLFLSQTQSSQSEEGEGQESQQQSAGENSDIESGNKENTSAKQEGEESDQQQKRESSDSENKTDSSIKQTNDDQNKKGQSVEKGNKTNTSSNQKSDQQLEKGGSDNTDKSDSLLEQGEQESDQQLEKKESHSKNRKTPPLQQMGSKSTTAKGKVLNKIETKSILDAVEKQEAEIRSRLFRSKSLRHPRPREKDW